MQKLENLVYITDESQNIVYFNEAAKVAYPEIEIGKKCHESLGYSSLRCSNCPFQAGNTEPVSIFNMTVRRWISMSYSYMDYPGHGRCRLVTGSFYETLNKELLSRLKFMNKFNFILEMNLSIDRYHMLSEENYGKFVTLEEEPLSKVIERTALNMVHPDDYQKFVDFFNLDSLRERLKVAKYPIHTVIRERSSNGSWDDVTITLIPQADALENHEIVLAFFYIDSEKKTIKKTSEKRNAITGLLDKENFKKAAEEFLNGYHDQTCLIYMDIEHFRFFNKWYSRWQGDRLLKHVGMFLIESDRLFGTVSGYAGGDNFFILCDKEDAVLDYIVSGMNKIVSSMDGIEGFRMCYGGYVLKDLKEDILDVIDCAESAATLDASKSAEKIRWYSESMIQEEEEGLKILPDIERAFEEREFTFFLQPKCSIELDKIVGAEALVRWKHKTRGFISPGEFIPPMEKNGSITKLDFYVWESVCKKISEWKKAGVELVPVSVNVSRIDIFNLDVPKVFSELVDKYEIEPELIEIEITESAFVQDMIIIRTVIQKLREKGFTILIDDFGSGYSSLNMLKDVQADVIKMDIKFFDLNQANFEKGLNIIQSVIDMSRRLGLPIIAEGVETKAQIDVLSQMGLNFVQGYFYYKPLPLIDYEALITNPDKVCYKRLH
ncbi:MAG: bifunctional diguanylate cyclase/phosphodiesterase [Treponema sp.]|nr:bifunctional diguanylate cyclase/phosphodiesterase [Treponema sp.]